VIPAAGIEGLKIIYPWAGIPIEVLRSLSDVAKERQNNP